ncbi:MAG TPA: DUF368 domain-containing protein [Flavobacteriaceae bacterium]|nr:DUF368 domain-containing protein [Flavobacteriaceae bacterium]
MDRSLKDYIIIFLKGLGMGAADSVPGVSGGTIAFISGIYEELITTIGSINLSLLKIWRRGGFGMMWVKLNGNFLIALFLGVVVSIFSLMRVANYMLENHPILIWAFFFGLVLASIWFVFKAIKKWHLGTAIILLISAVISYWLTTLSAGGSVEHSVWFLFLSGAIAVIAMILPGISGAFILVLLGAYQDITEAVTELDIKKIFFVAAGIIIGLLSFSKILKWLFDKYETLTLAALTGFIIGSLNKIWPWKKVLETKIINEKVHITDEKSIWPTHFEGDPKTISALVFFLIGFLLILLLEFAAKKMRSSHVK